MYEPKRILITGASGFIGSHIVEHLLRDRNRRVYGEVHALARRPGHLNLLPHKEGAKFHGCDLLDAEETCRVVASVNPHVIIHLASSPDGPQSITHSHSSITNNLVGTINLIDAFGQCENAEGFIYGDSTKSYGSESAPYRSETRQAPNSAYSITKAAAWDFIKLHARQFGFSAVAIRPTLVYGKRQPANLIGVLLDAIAEGRPSFTLMGGNQTRSPLYIDDAVDAYLRAACLTQALHGRVVNIGGPEELTIQAIAERVVAAAQSDMEILPDKRMRATDVSRSAVDLDEARKLLGWTPSVMVAEGVRRLLRGLVSVG